MNSQCIAYVSDENYFFPTAVSALQAKTHTQSTTDVVIILSEHLRHKERAQQFCDFHGIILVDASSFLREMFRKLDAGAFSRRVTVSSMGCLLLSDVLPPQYHHVIYIDGDTQINGSLSYLENLKVEPFQLHAALDYLSLVAESNRPDQKLVFNSGVLKFDRRAWIGHAAFEYFLANGGDLHDQGALNAVVGDGLVLFSNRWNFPKQFLHLIGNEKPTIVHFMAHPKPWDGRFFPWTNKEVEVYREALQANPCLAPFVRKISLLRYCVYKARSMREEMRFLLGLGRIRPYEERIRKVLAN
jgi:lipopolysaccharide biosynthesis glycosyltransferase